MMAEYIEREALINAMDNIIEDYKQEKTFSCDFAATVIKDVVDEVIRPQPAADVVEVRHGKWTKKRWTTEDDWGVFHHRSITCSVCEEEVYKGMETHYCPNCGAKMDGKGEV